DHAILHSSETLSTSKSSGDSDSEIVIVERREEGCGPDNEVIAPHFADRLLHQSLAAPVHVQRRRSVALHRGRPLHPIKDLTGQQSPHTSITREISVC